MRISTTSYVLKQGIHNIARNKWFSLASLATMTACIFLFCIFSAIILNFNHAVHKAEGDVPVTVFFKEGMTETEILEIREEISLNPQVKQVDYTSAEEAWENFSMQYFKDNEKLAEGFREDNPLSDSASISVYAKAVGDQKEIGSYIKSLPGVRKVNIPEEVVSTLASFNIMLSYLSVGVLVILILVTVFLIGNTVAVGIVVRKEEIGIMKLIGARDGLVRAPFLIEGLMIGLTGTVVPLILFYFSYEQAAVFFREQFQVLSPIFTFLPASDIFRMIVPWAIGMGLGIGWLGSYVTIRKHLRV